MSAEAQDPQPVLDRHDDDAAVDERGCVTVGPAEVVAPGMQMHHDRQRRRRGRRRRSEHVQIQAILASKRSCREAEL